MSINNQTQPTKEKPGPTRQYTFTEMHHMSSDMRSESVKPAEKAAIAISPRSDRLIWAALLREDQNMTRNWQLRTAATDEEDSKEPRKQNDPAKMEA